MIANRTSVMWLGMLAALASVGADPASAYSPLVLPTDTESAQRCMQAQKYIKQQAWPQAIRLLQTILDRKEDSFIEFEGKVVSARTEANKLLGSLPEAAHKEYQRMCGKEASQLLEKGLKNSDPDIIASVAYRYLHTEAGARAVEWLGTRYLDRGQSLAAALCFQRRLDLKHRPPEAMIYVKAIIAYRRTGDELPARTAWQALEARVGKKRLAIGERQLTLEELKKELENIKPIHGPDWPLFRGEFQ
ncbi:MAG: hypothetical protein AB7K24_07690 [Gemmataceae bacterium]